MKHIEFRNQINQEITCLNSTYEPEPAVSTAVSSVEPNENKHETSPNGGDGPIM